MTTEPWGGYMPEINAGRQEAGAGPSTWLAAGAMWTEFSALVSAAAATMVAELAALGINWQGTAPTAMAGAVGPFMGWLMEMEATAAANALSCFTVAEAYEISMGTMIPLPVVTQNRIEEAIAEATNFLGVNSGLILFLNGQYGDFWGNNGAVMVTYDEAVQTATIPKPALAPPPLANAATGAEQIGQAAAQAAAQQAFGEGTQAATNAMNNTVDAASSGTGDASSMSNVMSAAGPLLSAPEQALGQFSNAGSSLSSPLNSLTSPLTNLLGTMGGNTSNAGGFGMGTGTLAGFSSSGLGDSGGGASIGGGGMGIGGGLGGAMLNPNYPGPTGGAVRSQPVFNGVTARPTMAETIASTGPGSGGVGGGGGMSPMMHGGSGGGQSSKSRATETVYAVPDPADNEERSA